MKLHRRPHSHGVAFFSGKSASSTQGMFDAGKWTMPGNVREAVSGHKEANERNGYFDPLSG